MEIERRKLPDMKILRKFDKISEGNDNDRFNATKQLLKSLQSSQTLIEQGISSDVSYAVKRLVQGLSSDRKFARLGYSTALCHLLRSIDSVDCKQVFRVIEENTSSHGSAGATKMDDRNLFIGKAMGLLTLVQSGRMEDGTEIEQTVKELLALYNKKPYMQLLCLSAVIQLITQISHKVFEKNVLPLIQPQLSTGWSQCSPDTLYLLLVAKKYHPSCMKKLLVEHWDGEDLISEKNFTRFSSIIMLCTQCSYVTHPVVDQLIGDVKTNSVSVTKFWRTVCRPLLVLEKRIRIGPKHSLGLYIFQQLLAVLFNSLETVSEVLPEVCSVLVHMCSKKTEEIGKKTEEGGKKAEKVESMVIKARAVLSELAERTVSSHDAGIQLAVLQCLIKPPGNFDFDRLTNTNTVSQISSQLTPEAKKVFIEELMKGYTGKSSWIVTETGNQALSHWCVKNLSHMFGITEASEQLSILQFLFLYSFFNVNQRNKTIPHCEVLSSQLTGYQRKCTLESFVKTLSKLLTRHDMGVPKVQNLNQHIDLCYQLGQYVQTLLQAKDWVQIAKEEVHDEILAEWSKLAEVIGTINKKRNKEEITDDHAFELLFLFNGFQLFIDTQNILESLQDLYVCYKKSNKRRKSLAKDDGPAWIDVITEVLLSMMFNENALSRVVAKQVMSFLADHVTPSTIQLLVDALNQTSLQAEDGMVGLEDAEDDDDDSGDDDGDDDDDNNDDDDDKEEEEESSEDSGIEEENDLSVSDKLKQKVKAALGGAAAVSDEDDEEGDDNDVEFSDTEMFKLDSVLAAAFKSMAKGKKTNKMRARQLTDFKLRVLDLVDAILKSQVSPSVTVGFIMPLLDLMEKGMKKPDEENLGNKAETTLNTLLKQKRMKPDSTLDKDALVELVEQLIKYSSKVPVPSFVHMTGNVVVFVLKLLFGDAGLSPVRTRSKGEQKKKSPAYYQEKVEDMLKVAILDFLKHKHAQPAFFHILIVKYPLIFWALSKGFTAKVESTSNKVFERTQAAAFLANMISKELHDSVDEDSWTEFVTAWRSAATKVIDEMCGPDFKKNLLEEVVTACHQIDLADPGKLALEEGTLRQLLTVMKKCDKPGKKAIKKLTKYVKSDNASLATQGKKKKKDKKRKPEAVEDEGVVTPAKLPRVQQQQQHQQQNVQESPQPQNRDLGSPAAGNCDTSAKKKKKHKKNKQKERNNMSVVSGTQSQESSFANGVSDDEQEGDVNQPMNGEEELVGNQPITADITSPKPVKSVQEGTPKSSKKKKKKRRSSFAGTVEDTEMSVAPQKTPKKAKLSS